MQSLVRYLPRRHVSALVGWLAAVRLPQTLARRLIDWYCKHYGVETHELALDLSEFRSLAQFFVRDLKPAARAQHAGLTSPCDGELRAAKEVRGAHVEQIKGITYSLAELLGSDRTAASFEGGTCFNLYLSPRDYHQVHAPIDARIRNITYIPGTLWPVNDWATVNIPALFCRNERVVLELECTLGVIVLVMVGAFNVGSIRLTCADLITNRFERKTRNVPIAGQGVVVKGDKLGAFHLGSTVVLLTPAQTVRPVLESAKVRLGQTIAEVC